MQSKPAASLGTALIVGASTTIGAEYARQLAARGYGLVLVGRRVGLLDTLAEDVRETHGVRVRTMAIDLAEPGAVDRLVDRTADVTIDFLVCNANLHRIGAFDSMPLETMLEMLQMNTELPTRLAHAYGPAMVARGRGRILFINALNCMTALDIDAVFQGSKSYLLVFGESLWAEYRSSGVEVGVAMLSGIEGSESFESKLSEGKRRWIRWAGASMAPARIVAQTLDQLGRGSCVLIPDVALPVNRLGYQVGLAVRSARSPALTRVLSSFYRWLLDGEESQSVPARTPQQGRGSRVELDVLYVAPSEGEAEEVLWPQSSPGR